MLTPSAADLGAPFAAYRAFARRAGAVVAFLGLMVLAGWLLDLGWLKNALPGLVTMKANTALSFVLAGCSLRLAALAPARSWQRDLSQAGAALVALNGGFVLAEYLFGWNLGIDELLFRDSFPAVSGLHPGRMALSTAVCFSVMGTALLLLDRGRGVVLVQVLALAVALIALLALAGYLYSAEPLYRVGPYTAMALHTALGFLVLAAGMLAARPERGLAALMASETVGAKLMRRLLPAVILVPLVLGWLRLQGEQQGLYGTAFGVALFAVATGVALAVLVWWSGQRLHQEETERQGVERALRESEERFRATFEQAAVGVAQVAPDGRWLRVNQRLCDILGYTEGELRALTFPEITHPDDLDLNLAQTHRLLAGEIQTYSMEKRYHHKNGGIVWANLTGSMVRKPSGEPDYFVAVIEDISTRKQAETQLRHQAALLENVNDAIVASDPQYRLTAWNAAAEELYGWQAEEVLGRSGLEVLRTEWPGVDAEEMRRTIAETGRWRGEATQVRRDETRIPVEISSVVLRDEHGQVTDFISVNRDITTRLRAEAALREAQTLRAEAEKLGKVGGWEFDIDTRALTWTEEVFHIHEVDLTYQPTVEAGINFYAPASRPIIAQAVQCAIDRGEPFDVELEIITAKGNRRHIHSIGKADPTRRKVLGFFQDITAQKHAEEEIRSLNATLEQRVAERTSELAAAVKELEAFSYSVSHDLRAPLRAMDGFSRILVEEYGAQLDPEAQRFLQLVRNNTQQMGQLVDDLLAFSRLGRKPLERQQLAPEQLVHQALAQLGAEHEDRQVDWRIAVMPPCQADPALLRQVFANLLANALKFTRSREPAQIEVGYADGAYFVRDNGVGFDMRYVHKLFGVFQRLHRAEDYEGTGVGLAIVQRIIHRHGGRVWAEAQPDQGATFYFTLGGTPS